MKLHFIQRVIRKLFGQSLDKIKCRKYYKYYGDVFSENCIDPSRDVNQISAKVLLGIHQLEKGMSFTQFSREFGEKKALRLVDLLKKYNETGKKDFIFTLAINVLSEYLAVPNSTKNEKARNMISSFIEENKALVGKIETGTKIVSEPHSFDESSIVDFFLSRNSVREFSDKPITDDEIKKVMDFASCTPSACNRQASRVHVYRDKQMMEKLIENQLGNQNWCKNAMAIFVITSDLNYFSMDEQLQYLVDGGLYAMNFDWGLHLYHIASCFKMYIRLPEIDKEFHKISGIPQNEVPVVLILAGHYKEDSIKSPKSVRLPIDTDSNLFLH